MKEESHFTPLHSLPAVSVGVTRPVCTGVWRANESTPKRTVKKWCERKKREGEQQQLSDLQSDIPSLWQVERARAYSHCAFFFLSLLSHIQETFYRCLQERPSILRFSLSSVLHWSLDTFWQLWRSKRTKNEEQGKWKRGRGFPQWVRRLLRLFPFAVNSKLASDRYYLLLVQSHEPRESLWDLVLCPRESCPFPSSRYLDNSLYGSP